MGAQENKQTAQAGYEAFSRGDAEAAMRDLDDSIDWTVRGDNAVSGKYKGKQEVGQFWGQLVSRGFRTQPHEFVADGDKVVVLATIQLDGETTENADVLTYNSAGRLITFDTFGDQTLLDRAFPR
jgi:uncharacterized protein